MAFSVQIPTRPVYFDPVGLHYRAALRFVD